MLCCLSYFLYEFRSTFHSESISKGAQHHLLLLPPFISLL
ncbi:hypothetical protein BVRB_2g039780 [Beta vulgaris subsp. vulgaris]|nr:hypothetical protein BVRB_2g039780 [Beta vulgaris subsp. vulgaris]